MPRAELLPVPFSQRVRERAQYLSRVLLDVGCAMGTVAFPVAMLPHIEARNGVQLAEPGDEFDRVASLLADTFARAGFIEGATIKESTLHP